MMKVMKIMAISFKRSHECIATLSAPSPAAGHRWPRPPPEIPGHLRASLSQSLVESLLLSPQCWCTQGSVFACQESVSQSCVSSSSSMVGLVVTSSKRAYAIPRSAAPSDPAPSAGHCWPIPSQKTLKHSSGSVSGSWYARGPSLASTGFDSKSNFAPPTIFLGLLLCPWMWGIFFWWDPIFFSQWSFCSKL